MSIITTLKHAYRNLMSNKGRTVLTMLGVIIGAAALIIMSSTSQGAKGQVLSALNSIGNNVVYVEAVKLKKGVLKGGKGNVQTLKESDVYALKKECPSVNLVSPHIWHYDTVVHRNSNFESNIEGVNEDFAQIENWKIDRGRFFTGKEVKSSAEVCIIGDKVRKEIFLPGEDPVNSIIRVGRVPLKVIGTTKPKGSGMMSGFMDNTVIVPYTTMMKRIVKKNHLTAIVISASSRQLIGRAKKEADLLLRQRHEIHPGKKPDYEITTQEDLLKMFDDFAKQTSGLLLSVIVVSLIVGGIGIMNIMLVSVNERIREIGIRMALGAKKMDIVLLFLTESVLIALLGALSGLLLSFPVIWIFNDVTGWKLSVYIPAIGLAMGSSLAVGIIFGLLPAWKASLLQPVEALRC